MTASPHVFIASLVQETNTFVPLPTGLADFESRLFGRDGVEAMPDLSQTGPLKIWRHGALERGWRVSEGLHAYAEPGGTLTRHGFETMRDMILADLERAGPVDIVLLKLHGAMVATGYDDCEGDLLARVRAAVGPRALIGVEIDLHCHLTDVMVQSTDAIVIFKEYPHTDYNDRAHDLFSIIVRTHEGTIKPVMATYDCPVLGLFPTTRSGAMRDFVESMMAHEGKDGILSLSLAHGFPWADLPITGGRMLAVADGDPALAAAVAREFGRKFMAIKAEAALSFVGLDAALDRAEAATSFPVLLADTSDQTGGGAPGDSTYMLEAILARGLRDVCYAPLWDPLAVHFCFQAGEGARFNLRLGGKASNLSGRTLDLDVVVKALIPDSHQSTSHGEQKPVGGAAIVSTQGIDIILTRIRNSISSPSFYLNMGIDPASYKFIGIKSLYRYYDLFKPICADMIMVATPGACNPDWPNLPYRRLTRPIWPLDAVSD